MQRTIASTAIVGLFCIKSLSAGTVSFDPPEVFIDPAHESTTIELGVTIHTGPGRHFYSVDLLLGSDHLLLADFEYGKDWEVFYCSSGQCLGPLGVYPSDLLVGADVMPQYERLVLGKLTISAGALPLGSYEVIVDSDIDRGISHVDSEPMFGRATVHVVHEPATWAFLILGGALIATRRRTLAVFKERRHAAVRAT